MAIKGIIDKTPIINSPLYILVDVVPFPGLNKVDTEIFKRSCELALKSNNFTISDDSLLENISDLGLSPQRMDESIDVLESKFYVRATKSADGTLTNSYFSVTTTGFEVYAQACVKNYSLIKNKIYIAIAGQEWFNGYEYAKEACIPILIIENILNELGAKGLLEISRSHGWIEADSISPKIKGMIYLHK